MAALLTTGQVRDMINVDKSTIYRMAESGRIPAVKIGRQWRFPAEQIETWLVHQGAGGLDAAPGTERDAPQHVTSPGAAASASDDLRSLLPDDALQALADVLGDLLGVMIVFTDINGRAMTEVSNPCGLFEALQRSPRTLQLCTEMWHSYGADLDFTPKFQAGHLGFLCARAYIRVEDTLAGMVIAGGVAPQDWPPPAGDVERLAGELDIPAAEIATHVDEVYRLDPHERRRVLAVLPRIGTLVSQLARDRNRLVLKLDAIAALVASAPEAQLQRSRS